MKRQKDSEKTNNKSLIVKFDTEYMEDAYVYEFLTNAIANSLKGTPFTMSEVIISLVYDNIQTRIKDGRIIMNKDNNIIPHGGK